MSNEDHNVEVEEGKVVESKGFTIVGFIEDNSKNLLYAGIALIVLAGAFYYYTSIYKPNKEAEANSALYKAENMFAIDSLDLAMNGDGEFLGLADVADQYSSTAAGARAKYYQGRALMTQGKYEEALEYLDGVSFDDEIVAALAICLKADCKAELDQVEEAADLYMAAANKRENKFTTPYSLSKAARAYGHIGDWEAALEALEIIKADYSETQFAQEIDKEIARARAAAKSN